MAKYYVHTKTDAQGDHEVHKQGCAWMPEPENRLYLGDFSNCQDAVKEAKEHYYRNSNGCKHCSTECHSS